MNENLTIQALELLDEAIEKRIEEVRRKAYAEGFEAGRVFERKPFVSPKEEAQERRDRIVERAKKCVEELKNGIKYYAVYKNKANVKAKWHLGANHASCNVEFVVNKKKRIVVALMKGVSTKQLYSKGTAICASNDCFNVHIGKAIALRRALGLEVPDEYLNAPQPTEVRVEDVVEVKLNDGGIEIKPVLSLRKSRLNVALPGRLIEYPAKYVRIIDDSRDEVGG